MAAMKLGGSQCDWLGVAWEVVSAARKTFDPSRGASFWTYTKASAMFRFREAQQEDLGFRRTTVDYQKRWVRVDGAAYERGRQDRSEEDRSEPDERDVIRDVPVYDREMAWLLARGMKKAHVAEQLGVTQPQLGYKLLCLRKQMTT
jgi:hypothetical protein